MLLIFFEDSAIVTRRRSSSEAEVELFCHALGGERPLLEFYVRVG